MTTGHNDRDGATEGPATARPAEPAGDRRDRTQRMKKNLTLGLGGFWQPRTYLNNNLSFGDFRLEGHASSLPVSPCLGSYC